MNGGFCGVTAHECRSGPRHGVSDPACLRDGCGFEAGFVTFHKTRSLPQVVRANAVVRGFPVREESKVAWLESPDGLGATARISSSLTEIKQKFRRQDNIRGPLDTSAGPKCLEGARHASHPPSRSFGEASRDAARAEE